MRTTGATAAVVRAGDACAPTRSRSVTLSDGQSAARALGIGLGPGEVL